MEVDCLSDAVRPKNSPKGGVAEVLDSELHDHLTRLRALAHAEAHAAFDRANCSAVLQRMSLPVVNWVGGGGTRSPEKTKKANNFIVEPREIKIDVTGHEKKSEPVLTNDQTHNRQSSCVSSHRGSSNNGAVSTLTKKSSDQKVEMNWELQQDVEQAEFRQQRKRRAKKCFPFSICA